MVRSGRPRVVLGDSEKAHLRHDLEAILGRLTAVEEILTVAAWRSGTSPSEWTEKRLAAARSATGELLERVLAHPIDGD